MLDLHTHLYWKSYDADRDQVIERARKSGVRHMLCVGTTVEESRAALALAEKYPDIGAAVGIHPHEFNRVKEWDEAALGVAMGELRKMTENKKVLAIGECGLDYFSHDPKETITSEQRACQRVGFLAQVELARELGLPLIVHCRDAYVDLLEILQTASFDIPVILHCYMGDTEVTQEFLKLLNVYFSFTANITYPVKKSVLGTKDDLTETVRTVPLERLFTETDCPFLAPQEKRGERNEPANVASVVAKIAELKGMDGQEIENVVEGNYSRIFS